MAGLCIFIHKINILFAKSTNVSLAQLLLVVEDDGDADQSAAADGHGDEEGQPMGAALCRKQHQG